MNVFILSFFDIVQIIKISWYSIQILTAMIEGHN